MMKIKNTSQYLNSLDKIAEIIEIGEKTAQQKQSLQYLKQAVAAFEMEEINKYPASQQLVKNFICNNWNNN